MRNRISIIIAIAIGVAFLVLGIVFGVLFRLDSLPDRAFMLAVLALGIFLGLLFDWLLEEAVRRNRELARQLDDFRQGRAALETTQIERVQIERVQQQQLPTPSAAAALPADGNSDHEIASRTLAEFLRQRDEEVRELRDHLDEANQQIQTAQAEANERIQSQREEANRQIQSIRAEAEQNVEAIRDEFEAYVKTHPDTLTTIKGIGPVYQRKLRDIGINSFQQLAAADPDKLRRMLDIKPWQKVDIENWIAQSRDWM